MPMPYVIKDPEDLTVSKISGILNKKPELGNLSKGATKSEISNFMNVQQKWS